MRRVVVTGLGLVTPLGGDVETTWQNLIAGKSGIGPDHPLRHHRPKGQDRRRSEAQGPPLRFRPRQACRPQGPAPGRPVHRLRDRRRRTGARRRRAYRHGPGPQGAHRRLDRLGHRRLAGDRKRIAGAGRERAGARQPALRPRAPDQPHLGPGLDQIRADGPEPLGGHGLLDGRALDRRCRADDQGRRCRHHARRRRRKHDQPAGRGRLRPGARAQHVLQRPARAGQPPL